MKDALLGALVATLILASAYIFGNGPALLNAQGRGPVVPSKPRVEPTVTKPPLVYGGDSGSSSASANGFMAVTGSYGVGNSVLYLFDTENKQLLVYEARGGSQSMRRLVFVGARRIDLDLQLIDYNDQSELRRADLQRMFERGKGRTKPIKRAGVTVPGDMGKRLGTGKYKTTKKTERR